MPHATEAHLLKYAVRQIIVGFGLFAYPYAILTLVEHHLQVLLKHTNKQRRFYRKYQKLARRKLHKHINFDLCKYCSLSEFIQV